MTVRNMVHGQLLKSGKDPNSWIEHMAEYYLVNDSELALMQESKAQETGDAVLAIHPQIVTVLDNLFEGNNQLKTNIVLQMHDDEIEFNIL